MEMCVKIVTMVFPLLASPVTTAETVNIQTATGGKMAPLAERGQKATVCFFILAECPISRKYSAEIGRLVDEYTKKKIAFVFVHEDAKITLVDVRKHQSEFGIRVPTGIDRKHTLAKLANVQAVPCAALFDPKGKLLYSGRIDDRFATLGVQRQNPTRRDLKIAIDETLNGKPITKKSTEVVGCTISLK